MVTELQSAQSSRHRVEKSYELMGVGGRELQLRVPAHPFHEADYSGTAL